jgi:hypothetical protein
MRAQSNKPAEDDDSFEFAEDNKSDQNKSQPSPVKPASQDASQASATKPLPESGSKPKPEDTNKLVPPKPETKPASAREVLEKKNELAHQSAEANKESGRWRNWTLALIILAVAVTCVFLGVLM